MKKLNVKEIIIPAVALFVICLVVTALLGLTNNLTEGPIAEVDAKIAQQSRETVCPDAASFELMELNLESSKTEVYSALNESGDIIGYAISTAARGYGGDIKVMIGIDIANQEIIAINVYDNSGETPGLGANTSTESFMMQFSGADGLANGYVVNKDASKEPEKTSIDAVTGATISSRAVTSAVNEAVEIYNTMLKGGN